MGETIAQNIYNFITAYTPAGIALVCLAVFILGIMMAILRKKVHDMALDALPWVLIGAALIIGCMTIGKSVCEQFIF